ncbi:MAG TPA: PAS-domain containing protein, partial [Candidatus Acidoferrum sp.]|nr:PAS-domain containing protein [Candidatus Acidoferrum sp.]
MAEPSSTGPRRLLRKAGWPAAVVIGSAALGLLMLPYANTVAAVLLPNALALAVLLTVAVINERRRIEARTRLAEGELRAAEGRARAAEACLRDAIDSLNEGFALFDGSDRLVLCNRKYRELYAISGDLLTTGAQFEEIIREGAKRGQYVEAMGRIETWVAERMAQHRNPVASVLQQLGDGRWLLIREHRTQDGGTVGVWTDVSRLKNQELLLRDREQRLERTIEDLGESRGQMKQLTTEMTRLAKENAAHRERAEAANAAKSQFLANISHELRTPLNAILGFSEMMKAETFGPLGAAQYRGYIVDIHDAGAHLLNLINELLDLSKIEAGKFELVEDECDIAEIVEATVHMMGERAAQAAVAIEPRIAPALPLLRGDYRKVKQILFNLLSNALKFTPAGGRVTISADLAATGGVTLAVA